MNWEAIGAIGEILGATVVFITLVYLAIQVKYAKSAAADANRLARARGVTDMQLAMLSHPAALASFTSANGMDGYYDRLAEDLGVPREQALSIDGQCIYWFWLHWGQYRSQNSPEDFAELAQTIGRFYQLPAMAYSWENSPFARTLLEPSFVEFVEKSIRDQREPVAVS